MFPFSGGLQIRVNNQYIFHYKFRTAGIVAEIRTTFDRAPIGGVVISASVSQPSGRWFEFTPAVANSQTGGKANITWKQATLNT